MMSIQLFSSSASLSLVCFILVILVKVQSSSSNPDKVPLICSWPFQCGIFTAGYPFWGGEGCGHPQLKLTCEGYGDDVILMINDVKYWVLDINQKAQTLKISGIISYWNGSCPEFPNTTFDSQLFEYSGSNENVTLHYTCPPYSINADQNCQVKSAKFEDGFILGNDVKYKSGGCDANFTVAVPKPLIRGAKASWSDWEEARRQGIELKWKIGGMACEDCTNSNGNCGYDVSSEKTICYCPNTTQPFFYGPCPPSLGSGPGPGPGPRPGASSFFSLRWKISIGITAAVVGIIIIVTILLISATGRKYIVDKVVVFLNKKRENDRNMEAFVRNFGSFVPKKYSYYDVKRMTKSFSNKLGQGGYGDVYKGMLPDGRLVAVKFLKESKGNGEEFINEVASISRTSHVNIVTLLGFCYEWKKRALIYEFMPNGSLDKFIYGEKPSSTNCNLEWKTLYQIAVGIARGLEYLHRGCNTRIVHFDIKPHNILLDEDFCPKISDFGLAKLCKTKESNISMLGARGTIGYIAPEVYSRTFGVVSHKSDVYNYGMMILEMVGGRKNTEVRVSRTSEYFPNWIYKQFEPDKDFEFHGDLTQEEAELAKKMVLVSLWCIQTIPSDRPSMTRVVEMLEGGLEYLQVPPKPSLASKTRSSPEHVSRESSSTSSSVYIT